MASILSIIALIVALGLRGRVQRLEDKVKKLLNQNIISPQDISPQQNIDNSSIASTKDSLSSPHTPPLSENQSTSLPEEKEYFVIGFFKWFRIDWPMKLGAILLFLGISWIVTFVFWDVIGAIGQVTLGLLIGISILLFGSKRFERSENQGSILVALGSGVIYFTLFASRSEYDMFSPAIVLFFMFLVTVFNAFLSVVKKNFPLALLGLFLGGIAPLLTVSHVPNVFGLFSYIFVLCFGTLWIVRITGWRKLTIASLILYIVYALPILFSSHPTDSDQGTKMMIAIVFALLFFVASILSIFYERKAEGGDLAVSLINGFVLLFWIQMIILPEWQSFMSILVALVASIGAFIVYSVSDLKTPVYIHSAVAGLFIAMATAYELHGSFLVLAYIFETVALVLGARFGIGNIVASRKAMLVSVLPVILSAQSFLSYAESQELLTKDFFSLLFLSLMFFLFGILLSEKDDVEAKQGMQISFVLGSLYALSLLWMATHILFSPDQAIFLSLLVYTLLGAFFYVTGKLYASHNKKVAGAFLLIFVTGHLLLIDIWGMDVVGRIVTFCFIGILLISTAFIGNKKDQ